MHGREPFPSVSMPQNILSLQIMLSVTVVPLLFLSAVMLNACRNQARLLIITRRLIQAQEQERARIVRNLQDDVAQRLALVAVELEQFQPEIYESRSEWRTGTNKLREKVIQISDTVQAVSYELHPWKLTYFGLVSTATFAPKSANATDWRFISWPIVFQILCQARFTAKPSRCSRTFSRR